MNYLASLAFFTLAACAPKQGLVGLVYTPQVEVYSGIDSELGDYTLRVYQDDSKRTCEVDLNVHPMAQSMLVWQEPLTQEQMMSLDLVREYCLDR